MGNLYSVVRDDTQIVPRWIEASRQKTHLPSNLTTLSLLTDCQQVQLSVPQTFPEHSQRGDPYERYSMRFTVYDVCVSRCVGRPGLAINILKVGSVSLYNTATKWFI